MWDFFKPEENIWYCWHLNGAAAYIKKDADRWKTAFKTIPFHELGEELAGPQKEDPPDFLPVNVSRLTSGGMDGQIRLHPYFSSQPYILKLQEKLRLGQGQELIITAELPPVLKFELAPEAVIAEIMLVIPSRTLFGLDTMDGALGYSIPASLEKKTKPSALIYCDVLVRNNAKAALELEFLAIHPEPLNIYFYDNRLVTDILEMDFFEDADYKTSVRESSNRHTNHEKDEGYRLVSAGTKCGLGENIARHSIDIIKNITQF